MPEISSIFTNTYFDTAASNYLYDDSIYPIASQLVKPEKIIFGSDYPVISQTKVLNSLVAKIENKNLKEDILGRNILKLLKKEI